MDKIFSPIKEKVLYFIENQGIKKEDFYEKTSISASNFKGIGLKSEIGGDKISKILSCYPELSPEWLLTGKGEMLKNNSIITKKEQIGGIPLLPIEAFAGISSNTDYSIDFDTIKDRYVIPLFEGKQVDFLIQVRGNSMYPKYSSGDVVACKFIKERLYIQWNKVYVIDTASQGTMIKRLKKSEKEKHITFRSDNKDYDDFDVPEKDIRNLALVVGVIRLE